MKIFSFEEEGDESNELLGSSNSINSHGTCEDNIRRTLLHHRGQIWHGFIKMEDVWYR